MCCRYYFADQARKFISSMAANGYELTESKPGDVRPNDPAWILMGEEDRLCAEQMRFGLKSMKGGQLLINARSETAYDKPSFSRAISSRRCIIACDSFYEWDHDRQLTTLTVPEHKVILLAGIYDLSDNEKRFSVLTREANASMKPIHDRMPLILAEDQTQDWIRDPARTREILLTEPPTLQVERDYEQLSLF